MKIFIDAGFYIGKALEYYAPFMDETWKVYAFEPNEELSVENSITRFPFEIEWIKKGIWTEDGSIDFMVGGRTDASHIAELHPESQDTVSTVECVDFSKFISELPEDALVVCSMDIEGAEFPVLRKVLEDKTIQRISLLDIEFHHRLISGEDQASVDMLRRELESEGVLVKLKLEI